MNWKIAALASTFANVLLSLLNNIRNVCSLRVITDRRMCEEVVFRRRFDRSTGLNIKKCSKPFVTTVLLGADFQPLKASLVPGRRTMACVAPGPELIQGSTQPIQGTSLDLNLLSLSSI